MDAREYLSQAWKIDNEINSMLEQSSKLRDMATKTTAILSDMPGCATKKTTQLSDVVVKLVEQEEKIDNEIDRLVNLRAEIYGVIQNVSNRDERLVLEMRYMGYRKWPDIAEEMDIGLRQVYRIHDRGLEEVVVPDVAGETA